MRKKDHQDDCHVAATYDVLGGTLLTSPCQTSSCRTINQTPLLLLFHCSHYLIISLLPSSSYSSIPPFHSSAYLCKTNTRTEYVILHTHIFLYKEYTYHHLGGIATLPASAGWTGNGTSIIGAMDRGLASTM